MVSISPAARCLDPDVGGDSTPQANIAARQRTAEQSWLVCAVCANPITTLGDATQIDGRHDHRCVNPHGAIYDLGCFARAPGARAVGAGETWFSWFRARAWRVALCRGCGAHVGWAFDDITGVGDRVWGLIADALREAMGNGGTAT